MDKEIVDIDSSTSSDEQFNYKNLIEDSDEEKDNDNDEYHKRKRVDVREHLAKQIPINNPSKPFFIYNKK